METQTILEHEIIALKQRVAELQQVEQILQRRTQELDALYETTLNLMQRLDATHVFQVIIQRAAALVNIEHAYLCLVEPDCQAVTFKATMGIFERFLGARMSPGEGLTGRVWQTGEPLSIENYDTWTGKSSSYAGFGICAVIGVPIARESEVIGVLGLGHTIPECTISKDDIALMKRFAPLVAIALENTRMYTAIQQELAERQHAETVIHAQAEAIHHLSTPLIPISDRVVIMPLIGLIDSQRAHQVMETLLEGIDRYRSSVAILDITGVPVVDTQVANVLIQAAQAVRLLGAQVMLTGIQPRIAQTLVELDIDLSHIMTHSTLQDGIAHALPKQLQQQH